MTDATKEEVIEEPTVPEVQETVEPEPTPEVTPEVDPNVTEFVDEYKPNFEYTVMDEKKEFDEFLRGAITSKEQEEAVRKLYAKACGLDSIQEKRDFYKKEIDSIKEVNQVGSIDNIPPVFSN